MIAPQFIIFKAAFCATSLMTGNLNSLHNPHHNNIENITWEGLDINTDPIIAKMMIKTREMYPSIAGIISLSLGIFKGLVPIGGPIYVTDERNNHL